MTIWQRFRTVLQVALFLIALLSLERSASVKLIEYTLGLAIGCHRRFLYIITCSVIYWKDHLPKCKYVATLDEAIQTTGRVGG